MAAAEAVTIGTAVVALIEPHEGQARAFNAWYERDHFYAAAMAGPGMYAGARWVATRDCKELRSPDTRGTYLATYWVLPGQQAAWDEWAAREYASMPPERLFAARDHVHTAVYEYAWDTRADGAPAPATALDHGFAGVIMIAGADLRAWSERAVNTDVPLVLGFAPGRTIMTSADPGEHELALAFTEVDPRIAWSGLTLPAAYFASPFLATIPGTDTYTDEV
jgi:hypothetical protein